MDVIGNSVLIFAPLTLLGVGMSFLAAMFSAAGRAVPSAFRMTGRGVVVLLWFLGLVCVPIAGFGDWVHLFWSIQVPLVGLFLCSGLLRVETEHPRVWDGASRGSALRRCASPCSMFFMLASLGLASLILVSLFPEEHPATRPVGSPFQGIRDLVAWGFGGALPSFLAPATSVAERRGVDYLPRVLTVPFGTTLIAAWLWIAFATISFVAKALPGPRLRGMFSLTAAPALGVIAGLVGVSTPEIGPLDLRFFIPGGDRRSGIWTSDPMVMRSYAAVLLAAVVLLAILLSIELWPRRRRPPQPPELARSAGRGAP